MLRPSVVRFFATFGLGVGVFGCAGPAQRVPSAFDGTEKNDCLYNAVCPDGRTASWGQQRVNGDLMLAYLQEIRVPAVVKVAVVDSGFDVSGNRSFMGAPNFATAKPLDVLGDPTRDEEGHGTAVSGLVGGKAPIGLAPNLPMTSYRVVKTDSGGSTDSKFLSAGIEKACADGHEVINVSWGNFIDENDITSYEKTNAEMLKRLMEKGCLVIAAAGNASVRIERKNLDPDDNYFRIEAIAASGERAYFTSNGELITPGQGVFTLRSTQTDEKPKEENTCGPGPGQFINGTSFAAPIAAALAGQVMNVLKTAPRYRSMPPKDRINMVTRILRASQTISGHADGYLAVKMAHEWTKSKLGVLTPEAFFDLLKTERAATCVATKITNCRNVWECGAKRACMTESRRLLAMCGNDGPKDLIQDLLLSGYDAGAFELTVQTMRFAAQRPSGPDDFRRKQIARRTWEFQYKRWSTKSKDYNGAPRSDSLRRNMSFDVAAAIMPNLLVKGYVGDVSDADQALASFLSSNQFFSRLAAPEKKGSKEDLELVRNLVAKAQENLGSAETLKILYEAARRTNEAMTTSYSDGLEETIAWLRFLERLSPVGKTETTFQAWREPLATMEASLVRRLASLKTKDLPENEETVLLANFINRYPQVFAPIRQALESGKATLEQYRSPYGAFFMRDPTVSAERRLNANLRALELAVDTGMKEYTDLATARSFASDVLTSLREAKDLDPAVKEAAANRWWAVGRTRNPSITTRLMLISSVGDWTLEQALGKARLETEAVEIVDAANKLDDKSFSDVVGYIRNSLGWVGKYAVKDESGARNLLQLIRRSIAALAKINPSETLANYTAGEYLSMISKAVQDRDVKPKIATDGETMATLRRLKAELEAGKVLGTTPSTRRELIDAIGEL